MTEAGGARDNEPHANAVGLYTISIRVTPGCIRLEISKPYHDQGGWMSLLDAISDTWGDCGTVGGQQTLWAEVRGPRREP